MRTSGARTDESIEQRRLFWRCGAICTLANLAGAVFVFVFLVALAPGERLHDWTPYAIAFSLYAVIAFPLEAWWSERTWDRVLGWAGEARTPTVEEQEATLHLPASEAARSLLAWLVASVTFAVLCLVLDHRVGVAIQAGVTIVDGGLVTCAVVFLFFERALRRTFAQALASEPPRRKVTIGVRPRLLLTWTLGSAVPFAALMALPLTTAGRRADLTGAVVALATVGLVVGLATTLVAARSVADPLETLQDAIARVGRGQLDVIVPVDDGGEVGVLQAGVNHMVNGLRERHRLADLFGRHVGTEVARRALEQGTGLVGEQRDVTVMFVDLVGSTALAEVLTPEDVVITLNAFFGAVATAVGREGGWVNKFEGDGALCVFGAPAPQADHAARALRSACTLREQLAELAQAYPGLDAGIGVSSGVVVAGNVGTESRYEYTVIGGPVNEAARLTELAKGRPGRLVASGAALQRASSETPRWTSLGTVGLRGRSEPTAIYEPVRVREPLEY
jgi:adenylate cyclase